MGQRSSDRLGGSAKLTLDNMRTIHYTDYTEVQKMTEEKKRRYRAGLTKLNASIKVETKIWLLAQPEGAGAAIDRLVEKEVAEDAQKQAVPA